MSIPEMTDEEQHEFLQAMAAKPYRGACQICWSSLWFFDSEEEAALKMTEHLAQVHPNIVYWGPA